MGYHRSGGELISLIWVSSSRRALQMRGWEAPGNFNSYVTAPPTGPLEGQLQ